MNGLSSSIMAYRTKMDRGVWRLELMSRMQTELSLQFQRLTMFWHYPQRMVRNGGSKRLMPIRMPQLKSKISAFTSSISRSLITQLK